MCTLTSLMCIEKTTFWYKNYFGTIPRRLSSSEPSSSEKSLLIHKNSQIHPLKSVPYDFTEPCFPCKLQKTNIKTIACFQNEVWGPSKCAIDLYLTSGSGPYFTRLFETIIYWFFDKAISYFTSKEVRNSVQTINYRVCKIMMVFSPF